MTLERSEKRKLFDYQESKRRKEELGETFGNLVNSVVIDQRQVCTLADDSELKPLKIPDCDFQKLKNAVWAHLDSLLA